MINVNVEGSQIGVLNAGGVVDSISKISVNVNTMKSKGDVELAEACSTLSRALSSCDANDKEKTDLLHNLKLLTEETSKPVEERNTSLVGFVISHFDKILPTIESAKGVWDGCKDIFQGLI
ncbi:hypothetical protein AB3X91_34310 [Paraburkholderia sp. BR14263]|uniref:hypothetical protein n=1 Tax=unclassified Paraburkholderia TaxID=2615204 RepID=UPI0034CD85B7